MFPSNSLLIISSFSAMMVAQVTKVLLLLLTERSWRPERLKETGGMPSSHTAMVSALSTACILSYGIANPITAVAMVFSAIIVYDATGIRRATGRHAEILNDLIDQFAHLFDEESRPKALKTLMGHTYPQVLAGLGIGIATTFVVRSILSGA